MMSLRDYFAAATLQAMSNLWHGTLSDLDRHAMELSAAAAYRMADAMLEARKR